MVARPVGIFIFPLLRTGASCSFPGNTMGTFRRALRSPAPTQSWRPPLAIPVPPYRCLPNSSVRQKAADAVSQHASGGELESSITKQALCTLPS
ncbi:unnamed protein product [Bubo scandiacus]